MYSNKVESAILDNVDFTDDFHLFRNVEENIFEQ